MKIYFLNLILVNCFILVFMSGHSQVRDHKIGDTVPDFVVHHVVNYKSESLRLAEFRPKHIILDFWSVGCKPCIAGLPDLQRLQNKFKKDIQVLTVHYFVGDKTYQLVDFFKTNKYTKDLDLPCITDSILDDYFVHYGVPHQVWIDGHGVVKAITQPEYLTEENFRAFINDEPLNWMMKETNFFNFDSSLVSVSKRSLALKGPMTYSVLSGFMRGVVGQYLGNTRIDSVAGILRVFWVNTPVAYMYKRTLPAYPDLYSSNNRFVLEGIDSSEFYYNKKLGYENVWEELHTYTYEGTFPLSLSEEALGRYLRNDINRFLRLNGRIEKRRTACLLLVENSSRMVKQDKKSLAKMPISKILPVSLQEIAKIWNEDVSGHLPLINTVSGRDSAQINVPYTAYTDKDTLTKILNQYGFDLVQSVRELDMFVISK
jgi:thiol-disulfide isomerase/thioredoxin